ncbi:hypothetical protein RU639_011819 [Aspergillus parasiticus]
MLLTDLPQELIQHIIYLCDNETLRSIMAVTPQLQQSVLAVLKPEFQKRNFGLFKSLDEYEICSVAGKCICYDTPAFRRVMARDVAGIKQYLEWGLDLRHVTPCGSTMDTSQKRMFSQLGGFSVVW